MAKIKKPKQNNQDIYFHLPGMFIYNKAYRVLLPLLKQRPEVLRKNIIIKSVYGSPNCIWNGGRVIHGYSTKELLIEIRDFMAEMDIPVRFTFTNPILEEKHIYDTYGNLLLEIFNTGKNEILCNSEILENYIRKNYNYKYISSTTKRLNLKKFQSEEIQKKEYDLVVLDYDHNKDFVYLKNIEDKNRCELLCNPVCKPKCEKRKEHYDHIGFCQLNHSESVLMCLDSNKPFYEAQKGKNFISNADINNIYLPMGYQNFKLEGRTAPPIDWIEIILYYLIKDEYKPEIRFLLQSTLL